MPTANDLTRAVEAARAGARVIRQSAGAAGPVRSKAFSTDLVTEVDIASGIAVVHAILASEPDAAFLVEEEEVHAVTGVARSDVGHERLWLVDPLDGTTSFIHGFPAYSVSVALLCGGKPVVGAVVDAAHDSTVCAAEGLGATVDGVPARCSSITGLDEALLVTGFPYDRGRPLDRQLAVLARFLRAGVHGIRRDGSAALDCCHVAAGRADGFWEYGLQPWDTAAGVVICQEAGARVTDVHGHEWSPVGNAGIIVANPALHELMLAIVRSEDDAERLVSGK